MKSDKREKTSPAATGGAHNSTIRRYKSSSCCSAAVWLISGTLITSALHYLRCSFDYYSNLWPGLHFTRDFSVNLSISPNPHYYPTALMLSCRSPCCYPSRLGLNGRILQSPPNLKITLICQNLFSIGVAAHLQFIHWPSDIHCSRKWQELDENEPFQSAYLILHNKVH